MAMQALVVLGHPAPGSFNHAIADAAAMSLRELGYRVVCHDLQAEGFDAVLPREEIPDDGPVDPVVQGHCEELARADAIVIVHPNWWGQPPAILKGWIDRVLRPGVAYRFREGDGGEGVPEGLLRARAAVVLNTSNTAMQRELAVFGDPLETLWRNCIFGLCGVDKVHRRMFETIVTSSPEQRRAWLDEVRELVTAVFAAEEQP